MRRGYRCGVERLRERRLRERCGVGSLTFEASVDEYVEFVVRSYFFVGFYGDSLSSGGGLHRLQFEAYFVDSLYYGASSCASDEDFVAYMQVFVFNEELPHPEF